MRWLKPWLIALSILSAASAIQAQEDGVYEFAVIDILETIQQGAIEESVAALQGFLQQYPNSKLGWLLLADLYARRAGRSGPTDLSQKQSRQLAGLRSEIGHRWQRHRAPGPEAYGLIPSNLIRTAPRQDYIIAVDASRSRLYVLAKLDQRWHVIEDHYVTIGKSGMGKQKEGDLKTPLGVYFVTSYIDGATLPDRYGPGAFPINYPNAYDRGLSRTGYGIWIHGTESETFNRTPLASDGCLSLSNVGFNDIYGFVRARDRPAVFRKPGSRLHLVPIGRVRV